MNKTYRQVMLLSLILIQFIWASMSFAVSEVLKEEVPIKKPDALSIDEENPWKGSIQLGGVANTGNSSNKNFHGKLSGDYESKKWDNNASVEGQLGSNGSDRTSENTTLEGEVRYLFKKKYYSFARSTAGYDRFGPFDLFIRNAIGLGMIFYQSDKTRLRGEIGPGSNHSRIPVSKRMQHEAVLTLAAGYRRQFSEHMGFTQTGHTEFGRFNTHTKLVSAVKTRMTRRLALELSYTLDHNTQLPQNTQRTKKLDTITKIAVVLDF